MTTPLIDQLRDYFADIETQQGAIDVVVLVERESSRLRTDDDSSAPTTSSGARWWAGLVAAAAVVALVAGLVIMRSADDGHPVDDVVSTIDDGTSPVTFDESPVPTPTTEPATQPTVVPVPEPSAVISGWVDDPGLLEPPSFGRYIELPNGAALASVSIGLDVGQLARRFADDEVRRQFAMHGSETWSVASDCASLSSILGAAVITTTSWQTWDEAKAESVATFEVALSISGAPDDWVLEVENHDTGESLGTVHGSIGAPTLCQTLGWLRYSQVEAWFVIDGDGAELVHPDWADPSSRAPEAVHFVTAADGVRAIADATSGASEVWRTTDGRAWEKLVDAE